jgi:mRNA interferase RelE/StbE
VKVSFEASFARDLKGIRDKALLKRIEQVIAEVKTATALSEVKHLSKMRGYATLYRLRLGDYRIGIEVIEDEVIFVKCRAASCLSATMPPSAAPDGERYLELRQMAGERAGRFAVYDEIRARNPDAEPEQVKADVATSLPAQ